MIGAEDLDYIIDNPPFYDIKIQAMTKKDIDIIFEDKGYKKLDYVYEGYKKSFDYIKFDKIYGLFVLINSITQV